MTDAADDIAALVAQRRSEREIAWELGLAPTTVSYHVKRITLPQPPLPTQDRVERLAPPRVIRTRDRVGALLREGISRVEIARQLGLSKATVSYHARRLGEDIDTRCARRYDWEEVQRYYDEGHSVTECQRRFGFARASWSSARQRGDVVARPRAMTLEVLLAGRRNRQHVKRRLIALRLKDEVCESCGIADWLGRPLSLALHHVNGQREDNRLENLQLLCPNCHSQTATFSGRNRPALDPGLGASEGMPAATPAELPHPRTSARRHPLP